MLIRYLLCWFLLALVAIANGALRQATYGKSLTELAAHQVSTLSAIVLTGAVVWGISRIWPLESSLQAWLIGLCWLVATAAFEFGFGYFVAGHPWSKLFADYHLFEGRLWLLFLAWITVMPYVFYRYQPGD